jgi:hypothetical protein
MRLTRLAHPAFVLLLLLGTSTYAKEQRVPVTPPANFVNDPSLTVFRARLGEIARARDLKGLKGVVGGNFFWEHDFGGGYDPKASAVQNLIAALSLDDAKLSEEYRGSGWRRLEAIVASPMFVSGKHGGDDGGSKTVAACGPTAPSYNSDAIPDELVWGYVLDRATIYAKPAASGSGIATLENEAVEVLEPADAEIGHADFAKVKLPSGQPGFVEGRLLHSFLGEEICLAKRGGTWRIVGYIGGGD